MFQANSVLKSLAMMVNADNKKKWRKDIIYNHCGKKRHTKGECFRIISCLKDFKFTKGKVNYKKGKAAVNNVSKGYETAIKDETQAKQEKDLGGTSSMSHISIF